MAEQNITESGPTAYIDPSFGGHGGQTRGAEPEPVAAPDPLPSYEARARSLTDNVRSIAITAEPPSGPPPPARAVPDERLERALDSLADCISSAVASRHPRKFQAIRRLAKIAELLARERSDRGVMDVTGHPGRAMGYIGGDNDLEMDQEPRGEAGMILPGIGMGMNDGVQLTRDIAASVQQQADTQRGPNRAREMRDLLDMREELTASLKSKRHASHAERERLQSELDVIQKRIDALIDEIKRELPPEKPIHALVHP